MRSTDCSTRLSISQHANRFVLKGAQMMPVWIGETVRATRDVDLLGFGDLTDKRLIDIFAELCALDVPEDGMQYSADSIRITPIREQNTYGGRRLLIDSRLGNARMRLQVDVGIGDAVTPGPQWVVLPQLLDTPVVRLRAYQPETSIAEKLETIVSLGLVNSRMKDYFDIHILSMHRTFDRSVLRQAVRDTFARRGTATPAEIPIGLTSAFAREPGKALQWRSYLDNILAPDVPGDLNSVVDSVATFIWPVLKPVADRTGEDALWPPGGPWMPKG